MRDDLPDGGPPPVPTLSSPTSALPAAAQLLREAQAAKPAALGAGDLIQHGFTIGWAVFRQHPLAFILMSAPIVLASQVAEVVTGGLATFLVYIVWISGPVILDATVFDALDGDDSVDMQDVKRGLVKVLPVLLSALIACILAAFGLLLFVLPGLYLLLAIIFFDKFIVRRNMGPLEGLKASEKVFRQHWAALLVLGLMASVIQGIAMLTVVGAYLAYPLMVCVWCSVFLLITEGGTDGEPTVG